MEEDEEGWQGLLTVSKYSLKQQAFFESNCPTPFPGWLALKMHLPSLTKCKQYVFANITRHVSYEMLQLLLYCLQS